MKWNRKHVIGMCITLVLYAAVFWCLASRTEVTAPCDVAIFSTVVAFLGILLAWRPYRMLTILLIASITYCQMQNEVVAAPTPQQQQTKEMHAYVDQLRQDNPLLAELCVAGLIVGVGIILFFGLKKICKQCLPPVVTPATPPQPPATNTPPKIVDAVGNNTAIQLYLSDNTFDVWDVSGFTFENKDPAGNPYVRWFDCVIQSSTNLTDWTTQLVLNGWASSGYLIMVGSDPHGIPLATNLCLLGQTNSLTIPGLNAVEDHKFFRAVNE